MSINYPTNGELNNSYPNGCERLEAPTIPLEIENLQKFLGF